MLLKRFGRIMAPAEACTVVCSNSCACCQQPLSCSTRSSSRSKAASLLLLLLLPALPEPWARAAATQRSA